MKRLTVILISLTLTQICFSQIETTKGYIHGNNKNESLANVFLVDQKIGANTSFMRVFNKITKQLWTLITGDRPTADENTCPICHKKDKVIPIKYGKPNKKLMKQAEKGKVRLGGCDMSDRPSRYCKRDDNEF